MKKWLAGLAFLGISSATIAAVTVDETGTGFVGKGDVQLVFEWSNAQLQMNANNLTFSVSSVGEQSWECTNANNDKVQIRSRTVATTGLVASEARRQNQITGFNLKGFAGSPTITSEGPEVNSCPSGPWALTLPASEATQVEGGGLVVCHSTNCKGLAITQ